MRRTACFSPLDNPCVCQGRATRGRGHGTLCPPRGTPPAIGGWSAWDAHEGLSAWDSPSNRGWSAWDAHEGLSAWDPSMGGCPRGRFGVSCTMKVVLDSVELFLFKKENHLKNDRRRSSTNKWTTFFHAYVRGGRPPGNALPAPRSERGHGRGQGEVPWSIWTRRTSVRWDSALSVGGTAGARGTTA